MDGTATAPNPIDTLGTETRLRVESAAAAAALMLLRSVAEHANASVPGAAAARWASGGSPGGVHPVKDAPFQKPGAAGSVNVSPMLLARDADSEASSKRVRVAPASLHEDETRLAVVLHDDDIHSFDAVEQALTAAGIAAAGVLTLRVDAEGDVVAADGAVPAPEAAAGGLTQDDAIALLPPAMSGLLRGAVDAGLLVSLESKAMQDRTAASVLCARFLGWLASVHDGCADAVAIALCPAAAEPDVPTPGEAASSSSSDPLLSLEPLGTLVRHEATLPRALRAALSELIERLLQRPCFRRPFACAFIASVPSTARPWAMGRVSSKERSEELVVQAITTPSVARALTVGAAAARTVAAALHATMETGAPDHGAAPVGIDLDSLLMKHHLFSRAAQHLRYATMAQGAVQGFIRDGEAMDTLTSAVGRSHGSWQVVRVTGAAVEFPNTDELEHLRLALVLGFGVEELIWAAVVGEGASPEEAAAAAAVASLPSLAATRAVCGGAAAAPTASEAAALLGPLTAADVRGMVRRFAAAVLRRTALAAEHATAHLASRGLVAVEDAASVTARNGALHRVSTARLFRQPITPHDRHLITTPIPTTIERAHDPIPDFQAAPDGGRRLLADSAADGCAPGADYQDGGELVTVLGVEEVDIDTAPTSVMAPLHAAMGSAASLAAMALSPEDAEVAIGGIAEALAASPGTPAAALVDHPVRALVLARRAVRGDLIRNGELVKDMGRNTLFPRQSLVLGDGMRAALAVSVASGAVGPSELVALVLERHGVARTHLLEPDNRCLDAVAAGMPDGDTEAVEATRIADAFATIAAIASDGVPFAAMPVAAGDGGGLSPLAGRASAASGGLIGRATSGRVPPGHDSNRGRAAASLLRRVRRHVIHHLATGPCPRSSVAKVASGLVTSQDDDVDDDSLARVLGEVAERRTASAAAVGVYALRPEAWAEVDLFQPHVRTEDMPTIMDDWLSRRRRWRAALAANQPELAVWGGRPAIRTKAAVPSDGQADGAAVDDSEVAQSSGASVPAGILVRFAAPVSPPLVPCSPAVAPARRILHAPELAVAVRATLRDAVGGVTAMAGPRSVEAALHVLSLAMHAWPRGAADAREARLGDAFPALGAMADDEGFSPVGHSRASPAELDRFVEALVRVAPEGCTWPDDDAEAAAAAAAVSAVRSSGSVVSLLAQIVVNHSRPAEGRAPMRRATEEARESAAWCLRAMTEVPHPRLNTAAAEVVGPIGADAAAADRERRRRRAFVVAKRRAVRRAFRQIRELLARARQMDPRDLPRNPAASLAAVPAGEAVAEQPPQPWASTHCVVCGEDVAIGHFPLALTAMASASPAIALGDASALVAGALPSVVVRPGVSAPPHGGSASIRGRMTEACRSARRQRSDTEDDVLSVLSSPTPSVSDAGAGGCGAASGAEPMFFIGTALRSAAYKQSAEMRVPVAALSATGAAWRCAVLLGTAAARHMPPVAASVVAAAPPVVTDGRWVPATGLAADVHPCHVHCALDTAAADAGPAGFSAPLSGDTCNAILPLPRGFAPAGVEPEARAGRARAAAGGAVGTAAAATATAAARAAAEAGAMPPTVAGALAASARQALPSAGDGAAAGHHGAVRAVVEALGRAMSRAEPATPAQTAVWAAEEAASQLLASSRRPRLGGYAWPVWGRVANQRRLPPRHGEEHTAEERLFAVLACVEGACLSLPGIAAVGPITPHGVASDEPRLLAPAGSAGMARASSAASAVSAVSALSALSAVSAVSTSYRHGASSSGDASLPGLSPSDAEAGDIPGLASFSSRRTRPIGALLRTAGLLAAKWQAGRGAGEMDALRRRLTPTRRMALDIACAWDDAGATADAVGAAIGQSVKAELVASSRPGRSAPGPVPYAASHTTGLSLPATLRLLAVMAAGRDAAGTALHSSDSRGAPPSPITAGLAMVVALLAGAEGSVDPILREAAAAGDTAREGEARAEAVWASAARISMAAGLVIGHGESELKAMAVLSGSVSALDLRTRLREPLIRAGLIQLPRAFDQLYTLLREARPARAAGAAAALAAVTGVGAPGAAGAAGEAAADDSGDDSPGGDADDVELGDLMDVQAQLDLAMAGADSDSDGDGGDAEAPGEGGIAYALCLQTGTVLRAAWRDPETGSSALGECTWFAERFLGGVGVFLLASSQTSDVLLVNRGRSAYYPSVYVDKHGEPDRTMQRRVPLVLSKDRYLALMRVVVEGGVGRELERARRGLYSVLRDDVL